MWQKPVPVQTMFGKMNLDILEEKISFNKISCATKANDTVQTFNYYMADTCI
jgi:hypothetical protein